MRIIKKFPLPMLGSNIIKTSSEPKWLSVGFQGENLMIWGEDINNKKEGCWSDLWCIFTGMIPPEGTYIGTAQSEYGIVCHVYEVGRGYL